MASKLPTKLNTDNSFAYKAAVCFIISIGIFLRLYHFFYNRSLWEDEIYLSSGIIKHTFKDIFTQPLPYLQKAPLGYLIFDKLGVMVLGATEKGLRFYPLLCGIASLFVFVPVSKYLLKPAGQILAIAVLSFAPPLIYHSAEAKPYIAELLASLIIIWWYIKYRYETSLSKLVLWGLGGAVIVWFCYSAIFVLAATGMAIAIPYLKKKNWKVILSLSIPAIMWIVSFIISYFLYAKDGSNSDWLVNYWAKVMAGYMPHQPAAAVVWLMHRLFSFFDYPLGLSWLNDWREHNVIKQVLTRLAFVPLILFITGIIYFYKNNRSFLMLVGIMFLIAVTASALKLYPMDERLTTYLSPFGILLFGAGFQFFLQENKFVKIIGYVLAAILVVSPLKVAFSQVINPNLFGAMKKSYQREALFYLNDRYQPGDMVYVYRNDIPGYLLYKKLDSLKYTAIIGNDYRNSSNSFNEYFSKLENDIIPFKGKKRVWIIYGTYVDWPVGEWGHDPIWYYINKDQGEGVKLFKKWILSKATEKECYQPGGIEPVDDIHVCLLDFSSFH